MLSSSKLQGKFCGNTMCDLCNPLCEQLEHVCFHSSFLCRMDISNVCTSLSVACIKDRKNTQITDLCRTATEAIHFTLK